MKCVVTSDIHTHMFKDFDRLTEDGKSYRLSLYEKSLWFVWEYCKLNGINIWTDAGDFFHSRESISLPVLDLVGKTFNEFEKKEGISGKIFKYFLKGNHDTYNKSGNITSLNILSQYGKVINEQCIINVDVFGMKTVNFIPWNETINFVDVVNKNGKTNLIIGHRMLSGAKTHNQILDGELLENLNNSMFDCALIGHVHEHQKIRDKVYYIGSLISHNFGDKDKKGFLVYDFDTKMFEFVENPYSPKYIQLKIETLEQFEQIKEELKKDNCNFYDIKFELKKGEKRPEFECLQNVKISVIKESNSENRLKGANLLTPEVLLEKFKEMENISEEVFNVGRETLIECLK